MCRKILCLPMSTSWEPLALAQQQYIRHIEAVHRHNDDVNTISSLMKATATVTICPINKVPWSMA